MKERGYRGTEVQGWMVGEQREGLALKTGA